LPEKIGRAPKLKVRDNDDKASLMSQTFFKKLDKKLM
jgi:hypothetical protein